MKFFPLFIIGFLASVCAQAGRTLTFTAPCLSYLDFVLTNTGTVDQSVRLSMSYSGNGSIITNNSLVAVMTCPSSKLCYFPTSSTSQTLAAGEAAAFGVQCVGTIGPALVPLNWGVTAKIEIAEDVGTMNGYYSAQMLYYTGGPPPAVQINNPMPVQINSGRPF